MFTEFVTLLSGGPAIKSALPLRRGVIIRAWRRTTWVKRPDIVENLFKVQLSKITSVTIANKITYNNFLKSMLEENEPHLEVKKIIIISSISYSECVFLSNAQFKFDIKHDSCDGFYQCSQNLCTTVIYSLVDAAKTE